MSENEPVGASVLWIVARDPDLQGSIQFEVRGVAPGTDFFDVDTESGWIVVKAPLDSQTATSYTVSEN